MNIRAEVIIDRPRARVVELITDPANTPRWQAGVKGVELISGVKDQPGAQSRVTLELNGLRLEAIETVITHQPPEMFASTFAARGVTNTVENRFYELAPDRTRWVMDNTLRFRGPLAVAEAFAGNVIAKQTVQAMNRFKTFAESQ